MSKATAVEKLFNIKLYDYQNKWVNDTSRFRIVNKSRQVGFSWICAVEALSKAMFVKQSTILFVSTSQKGADRIMKYVRDLWYTIPEAIQENFKMISFTKQEIEFKNGSKIVSLPNNPNAARGYPATDVYLDEFAFLENETKMWEAIMPTTVRKDVIRRISLMSTPFGKRNTFYKVFMEMRKQGDDIWSRHRVHYTDCPDLDTSKLRATMTEQQFRQEFCCEFIDEVTAVFPYELIHACIPGHKMNLIKEDELIKYNSMPNGKLVYAGVDFGKIRDSTVVTYFEKLFKEGHEKPFFNMLRMDVFEKMRYVDQIPLIVEGLRNMKSNQVIVDQTGVGEKLYEDLQGYNFNLLGIKFSNSWKENGVNKMIRYMQSGRIKYLNDERIVKQFHDLQKKITRSNNARYEHSSGEHDDIFWSIVLALDTDFCGIESFGFTGGNNWYK